MKTFIKEFCQGIYDSMADHPQFIQSYTLEMLTKIFYDAFLSLLVKVFTILLGIVACGMASCQFSISFSMLFWVWITCCIVWISSDDQLKKAALVLKDIAQMK